jgi:hypothetical protein
MKLSSELLLQPLLTQCLSGFARQGDALGPPFLDTWLQSMGTRRSHQPGGARHPWARGPEPPPSVQNADACDVHPMEVGRWQDDQAH